MAFSQFTRVLAGGNAPRALKIAPDASHSLQTLPQKTGTARIQSASEVAGAEEHAYCFNARTLPIGATILVNLKKNSQQNTDNYTHKCLVSRHLPTLDHIHTILSQSTAEMKRWTTSSSSFVPRHERCN
jgi:hypothetical protein